MMLPGARLRSRFGPFPGKGAASTEEASKKNKIRRRRAGSKIERFMGFADLKWF
jgi:hypothetical protein